MGPSVSEPEELERALAATRLLALDVDGTLTDGRVLLGDEEELVCFHVHDGQGLVWLRDAGVTLAWISGRGCGAVERRARELGVHEVHLRVGDKERVLAERVLRARGLWQARLERAAGLPGSAPESTE